MVTVNIHEAKTQLSKLVDQAVKGEAFVIAKAGKPLVKVAALNAPPEPQRLGFLAGEIDVPEDFNVWAKPRSRPGSGAEREARLDLFLRRREIHGNRNPGPVPGQRPELVEANFF